MTGDQLTAHIEVVTRNLSDTNQEIETNGYEIKLNEIQNRDKRYVADYFG